MVFPAQAGVIPAPDRIHLATGCIPRASGGDPARGRSRKTGMVDDGSDVFPA